MEGNKYLVVLIFITLVIAGCGCAAESNVPSANLTQVNTPTPTLTMPSATVAPIATAVPDSPAVSLVKERYPGFVDYAEEENGMVTYCQPSDTLMPSDPLVSIKAAKKVEGDQLQVSFSCSNMETRDIDLQYARFVYYTGAKSETEKISLSKLAPGMMYVNTSIDLNRYDSVDLKIWPEGMDHEIAYGVFAKDPNNI